MMNGNFDRNAYLNNIYTNLLDLHQENDEWTRWIENPRFWIEELTGNVDYQDNADVNFISALCAIARNDQAQSRLAEIVVNNFINNFDGDLTNIENETDCENLGFYKGLTPYSWLTTLSATLREQDISFSDFLQENNNASGIEIRNEILGLIGTDSREVKRISLFIRDFLEKDTFPLDSNVKTMLRNLGLPENEEQLVNLCNDAGIDPKRLERLFYLHGKHFCQNNNCKQCTLNQYCTIHRFND
jgi:hypothetical protein